MLIIAAVILIILFMVIYRHRDPVPRGMTNLLEMFVEFVRDEISVKCLGEEDGKKMTPLFCTFFFFILMLNAMGLIPIFSTATANINVTGALALVSLGFMIFGSMYKLGVGGFFKALIPSGVPAPILIILFPIEFLGLFIKAVALCIRLFANMLAGHIVILALLGLIVIIGWAALPVMLLALFIYMIEILVVVLQAYIFTLLSAMFIGQMYHPHH
jgi:F-type H+-transporting ATPase subunit a